MARFFLQRFGQACLALFVLTTLVFFMFRLLPADPTAAFSHSTMSAEVIEQLRQEFGLDQPIYKQYLMYIGNLLIGNFGISFFYKRPVLEILGDKMLNTLILGLSALIIAYGIGIVLGALLAWYRGTRFEVAGIVLSLGLKSAPEFWVSMIFIMIFSYGLDWFPHSGMREVGYGANSLADKYLSWDFLHHLTLPCMVLVLLYLALPMLLMRNTLIEIKHEPYIELAYAKGLPVRRIIFLHAVRNALLPVVTTFATSVGRSIGGVVLVEYVFSWPGLGREIVMAASRYDFPLAQTSFLMIAAMVMLMNIIADVAYGYLDPRITYK